MTSSFKHLFTPYEIRNLEIRNRIFSTAHQTIMAVKGAPGEDMAAYHEARAAGGAGLIVMESSRPNKDEVSSDHYIDSSTDDCIPGYRLCAEAVHRHGCKIFGQINHGGRITHASDGLMGVAYAPSAVPDHRFHSMPRAMTEDYIWFIIDAFAKAAGRMAEAGLDGIELAASHGLLLAQFLNPETNLRDDDFGGNAERRFRIIAELLTATRTAIGSEKIIGIRISADELEPDGIDSTGWLEICKRLDREPELDFINVTAGSMMGLAGSIHVVPPMQVQHAYLAPQAGAIKQISSKAVFVAGRINQPQIAEQILESGQADLCGMTRALISDPEMPNKARKGRLDDIRACIGCNQACIGHYHMGVRISCIQNPVTGRERELTHLPRVERPKSVLVVGGGPAGMKAAAAAAERGHRVTLCEAAGQLGGQTLLAQALPERAEFGGIVGNLKREMELAGVEVRLRTPIDREAIEELAPEAVILATGAKPYSPRAEIGDNVHAIDVWQLLRGEANPGQSVVIADWRCDWIGLGVAEKLAREGCHVRLCVDGEMAGQNIQKYLRWHWVGTLQKLGVEIIPYARFFGADGDTAFFLHTLSGEAIECAEMDTLVLAQGHQPVTALEEALRDSGLQVYLAGDCRAARTAEEAVFDGLEAGRTV